MLVTTDAGGVVRIDGDPENTATRGRVCVKGLSYARRVVHPDRLLHPLRRRERSGSFEKVPWKTAIQGICEALSVIRETWGPEAVLYYEASGSHGALDSLSRAFWHQFGGCTLTYGDLCWPAGLEATRLTYGANLHNHPRLTRDSRFILLWGHNPAETNVHQWRLIQDALESGARLAVVDPRGTDTTDAAHLHLRLRPGTDAALALGLARALDEEGLLDEAFLANHAQGFQALRERAGSYPVARTAEICGLAEEEIRELAREYGSARPALLIAGFGAQRHHHAGQTLRAVASLPALTGNVGIPGGGWQYANLASHCLQPPPLPPEPPGLRQGFPISRLGRGLEELQDPPIRGIWIERGNPASQNPRSGLVKKLISSLDLVVVVDQRLTDSANLADWVLPAKSLFEEEDLVTAYWHPYLQLRQKILESPGETRPESEIWRLLCQAFDYDTSFIPNDLQETLLAMLPEGKKQLLDELRERPVDPSDKGDVAFADGQFPTPSGKIELASQEAARRWSVDPVPDYRPLAEGHASELARRFPLQLLSCKTRERIHSQFGNVDWIRDVERPHVLDIHPKDARSRGLGDGDLASVWNDRGRIAIQVRLDHGLRRGVVHILEGRCHDGDPEVNLLTDDGVTDMNHGATFYECLVEVEKA
jgi:anaerobic selenocysteine-containing dehydrogenase